MKPLGDKIRKALEGDFWFSSLPPELRKELKSAATIKKVPDEQVVYAAGSPPSGLYAILSGSLHILHFDASGKYRFYHVFKPVSWFGVLSAADSRPQMQTTVAAGPSTILHIDHVTVQRFLATLPNFAWHLARLTAHQARQLAELVADSTALSTSDRIAKALLAMSESAAPWQRSALISNINQEMLAAMVGVSRQTISRQLKAWEAEGLLVIGYRSVTIADLRRFTRVTAARKA
jgi:CRP-like cAMP-binding protein